MMEFYVVCPRIIGSGIEYGNGDPICVDLITEYVDMSVPQNVVGENYSVFLIRFQNENYDDIITHDNVFVWDDNPIELAAWLNSRGVSKQSFENEISNFSTNNQNLIAAFQQVGVELGKM